jgi:hypothetical protein
MISRQIGWSNESNLLYQILKQITRLTSTLFSLKEAATPKYKVYTALLTQAGELAPVATVLENTIGNIWFTYNGVGQYTLNSSTQLTTSTFTYLGDNINKSGVKLLISNITEPTTEVSLYSLENPDVGVDSQFINTPVEIRVYN